MDEQFDRQQDIQGNKILAALSYLGILFIIPLIAAPNSKFARFHANQGLILFIFETAYNVAMNILDISILRIFPLSFIRIPLKLIPFAFLIFAIFGIVQAFNGAEEELPFIGSLKILK